MTSITFKKRAATRTLYQVLGCPPCASRDELRSAYLAAARMHHPDAGGDAEAFKAAALAWGVLKDRDRRRAYDQRLYVEGGQCAACQGRGRKWRFPGGEAECAACGGTGQARP